MLLHNVNIFVLVCVCLCLLVCVYVCVFLFKEFVMNCQYFISHKNINSGKKLIKKRNGRNGLNCNKSETGNISGYRYICRKSGINEVIIEYSTLGQ